MRRRAWMAVAASGGLLLALASIGLVPMIQEGLAVRGMRDQYAIDRLATVTADEHEVTFECGATTIVVSHDPALERPTEGAEQKIVDIRVGDQGFSTEIPIALNRGAGPGGWAWNRVVPFRRTDRTTGEGECGVAHRLPSDTAAIRRAREDRPTSELGLLLEAVRGIRIAPMHGWRFRVLRWRDGEPVRQQDYAYPDWNGDPYGTSVLAILGSPVGVENQSLSYWPSLVWPILYPFGLALLGFVMFTVGLLGRFVSRAE